MMGRRAVEMPPARYTTGPTLSGHTTERLFDNPFALQQFCADNGALFHPAQRAGDSYAMACYLPGQDLVVLPSRKGWPSQSEINDLRIHEWAHARGWRHNANGYGTAPDPIPTPTMTGSPVQPPPGLMTRDQTIPGE